MYIQVDNCALEFKNGYFSSYFKCLMTWGVLRNVEVSFRLIDHTQKDVDQASSTTSESLSSVDAIILTDLHFGLQHTYRGQANVVHPKSIVNWSGLCEEERALQKSLSCHNTSIFLLVKW